MYVGLTADFGNRVTSLPPISNPYFKTPAMPSPGVTFGARKPVFKQSYLQCGVATGIVGYNFKVQLYDSTQGSALTSHLVSFPSFNTFYFSGNVGFGRHFQLSPSRQLSLSANGGYTFYGGPGEAGKTGMSSSDILFEYELSRLENKPKAFIELAAQTNVSERVSLGIRYLDHFNAALEGSYKVNHAKLAGHLWVVQRVVGLQVLIRVS